MVRQNRQEANDCLTRKGNEFCLTGWPIFQRPNRSPKVSSFSVWWQPRTGPRRHPDPGVQPRHRRNALCRPFLCPLRLQCGPVLPCLHPGIWPGPLRVHIGLQVGPGFAASLRRQGLSLNLLAAGVVLLGVSVTVRSVLFSASISVSVRDFRWRHPPTPRPWGQPRRPCRTLPNINASKSSRLRYGICRRLSFGMLGIILAMALVKSWFHLDVPMELKSFQASQQAGREPFARITVRVTNPNLAGISLSGIPHWEPPAWRYPALDVQAKPRSGLALEDTPCIRGTCCWPLDPRMI